MMKISAEIRWKIKIQFRPIKDTVVVGVVRIKMNLNQGSVDRKSDYLDQMPVEPSPDKR